ncbi:MAG: AAA family ATPase, partial [Bryobacteraceae bacterium]
TVALNVTVALSRITQDRVLLADFDLNQGLVAFMLKMDAKNSVIEAAERSAGMEENLWAQLVLKRDNMDVLGSGVLRPGVRIEPAQVRHMLDFCRRCYGSVSLDLSGNMEKYSIEIMQESKLIFMVTTPEIPSLHLARGKIRFLESLGLGDRIRLLLNRTGKRDAVSGVDVEKLLGVPLHATFPNDYVRVHHALTLGKEVDATSELGKRFATLASAILERKPEAKPTKRLADYFSVVQARFN